MSFFEKLLPELDLPLSIKFEEKRRRECQPITDFDVGEALRRIEQRISHARKQREARSYLLLRPWLLPYWQRDPETRFRAPTPFAAFSSPGANDRSGVRAAPVPDLPASGAPPFMRAFFSGGP